MNTKVGQLYLWNVVGMASHSPNLAKIVVIKTINTSVLVKKNRMEEADASSVLDEGGGVVDLFRDFGSLACCSPPASMLHERNGRLQTQLI